MSEIVTTNVVASRPPECGLTAMPTTGAKIQGVLKLPFKVMKVLNSGGSLEPPM